MLLSCSKRTNNACLLLSYAIPLVIHNLLGRKNLVIF